MVSACGCYCLDLFHSHNDDMGMHMWTLRTASKGGPHFSSYGPDVDALTMIDDHQGSAYFRTSMCSNKMITRNVTNSIPLASNVFVKHPCGDVNGVQADRIEQADISNGVLDEDWISLSLGGTGGVVQVDPGATNRAEVGQQVSSKEGCLEFFRMVFTLQRKMVLCTVMKFLMMFQWTRKLLALLVASESYRCVMF